MNTRILSLLTAVCFVSAGILLVVRQYSSVSVTESVVPMYHTVESYRCIECNPDGEPYTDAEMLREAPDDNAQHFVPVLTKIENGQYFLQLETKNLRFRELTMADVDAVYQYARKPMVAARTAWPVHTNKAQTIRQVEEWVSSYRQGLIAPWGVEEKASGKLIGTAGTPLLYSDNHRAQLAYCLSDTAWGNSYEVEIVRALVEYLFVRGRVKGRVEALARVDDPFTQKVLEQAGMSREGTLPAHKLVGSDYVSFYMYALVRQDVVEALAQSVIHS